MKRKYKRDAMSTLIIYNPDFEVEDYVSGYDFWYEMHENFLIVKGSKAKLLKLIKDLKLEKDDYEFENDNTTITDYNSSFEETVKNLKELKKGELNKTKKDSNQLTIEMSTDDFDDNFTYEEDYEPDIPWLTKTYNISIDRHDDITYIIGKKKDLIKLLKDHHIYLKFINNTNLVNDSGLQLKDVHKGFAILLDKYYKKYGKYAFVEAVEPTPELASKTCSSLEVCDRMKYIIINCNKGE